MDVCNNEDSGALALQKVFPAEDSPKAVLVTLEKNHVVLGNGKLGTREITSRYKSGVASAPVSSRPSSPNASRASSTPGTPRAQSAERRRPSTPSSRPSTPSSQSARPATPSSPSARPATPSSPSARPATPSSPSARPATPSSPSARRSAPSSSPFRPSSPSSRSSVPSQPSTPSRPSTPTRPSTPSSPSSRSSTPVRDSIIERLNSSRRSLAGRAPDGLWPSMRSLSSSFQSESSVLSPKRDSAVRHPSPDHTLKSSANSVSESKRTPLRGRNTSDQSENSRPMDNSHAKVIDQLRWPGIMGGMVSKSMDLTDKINRSSSLSISTRGLSPSRRMPSIDSASGGLQKSTNVLARRVSLDGSERAEHVLNSAANATAHTLERTRLITRQRSQSPIPALHHPSSPNKASPTSSSTSRGMLSPSRTRPSSPFSLSSAINRVAVPSSVLNYIADVQKGRKGGNHMEDAHQLRLLYNRDLQWRFVNAQADAALSTQKLAAEDVLYNVWKITSDLRDSIIMKRIDVQNLRMELKLGTILKEQIAHLEDWTGLEREHASSLSGAIEALKASTLRLPVTGGARADLRAVKNAISSAVDVMQAMGSSICSLLSRVEGTNYLVSELSEVAAKERAMLDGCRELLASTASMKVQECSLRTHIIQLMQDVQILE